MQITGVQTVGARSFGSVTNAVTVTEPGRLPGAGRERDGSTSTPRTLTPEPVVFPRDGKPLDRRPVQLRQQRANARYREDGRAPKRRETSR